MTSQDARNKVTVQPAKGEALPHWYAEVGFDDRPADQRTEAMESRRMAMVGAASIADMTEAQRIQLAEDGETRVEGGSTVRLVACTCKEHLVRVAVDLDDDPAMNTRHFLYQHPNQVIRRNP
jgi:hypothetical protein